ncbi:MAG: carboxy terminal-processing peptidase [Verrucomicrobiota bacterium]|jgi:carboxyl-terminal processing protease
MSTQTNAGKIICSFLPGNCVRGGVGVITLVVAFCGAGPGCFGEGGNPTEADITRAMATLLVRSQFLQQPLDDQLSGEFLDLYLDTLDGAHLSFLQSDLDEFARFRPGLAERTILDGDTQPAHFIYARYLKRLAQEEDFAAKLLHDAKFDFTGHDAWQADRRDAPRPRELEAAQTLWREEVREDYLQGKLAGDRPTAIVATLARHYHGRLKAMEQLGADEVLGIYLDALAHVYDPHSDYFGRLDAENFNIEMNLSLTGIGGTLHTSGGHCFITDLTPGGPAARSGLVKPGDRIVAVAQEGGEPVAVTGMPACRVVELIRGPKGSTVRLTIIPAGAGKSAPKTVSLVRDEVKLSEAQARAVLIDLPQSNGQALRIGVVDLPLFYGKGDTGAGGAADDTARLLKRLKQAGMRGLILDLRRNGGGSLDEAIRLTGLFIPSGPVVQTLGQEDELEVDISPQPDALYGGPLVVLTSRLSASASEIVAGALQDYGRALIVGDSSTFGKGTVQTVVPLKAFLHERGLGAVNLTIGKFYRPSGDSTQLKGVVPDIVLPSETDLPDIGESRLPNALPWSILPAASYTNFDLVRPVLAGLRAKSSARVTADPGFRLVREELEMIERDEKAQTLSLNEAERRKEKTQADRIRAQMEKVLPTNAARTPPATYTTLAEGDAAPPPGAASSPIKLNAGGDIELREAENILADYIHALPAPAAMLARSPVKQADNK